MRTGHRKPPSDNAPSSTGQLHPRNRHQGRYNFDRLILADAGLGDYVSINTYGERSIDFADPAAVRALNRALLKYDYDIQGWDIPPQNLCPAIPGRADYIHYLADLLAADNRGIVPKNIQALDIGTGASCIYPLIGLSEYGWHFVASDINSASLAHAQTILDANPASARHIALRLQLDADAIFRSIVRDDEWFDLTLCNPPFHTSAAEANTGTQRKWRNLGKPNGGLNFGGADAELWCAGGEQAFIGRMIAESAQLPTRCYWFTTLVSKSASLPGIYAALNLAGVQTHKTVAMGQGQKQSRLVAWTFLNPVQQAAWRKLRW